MTFNWRCTFGLHPWAKWCEPYKQTIKYTAVDHVRIDPPITVSELRQNRQCPACGKVHSRKISS